MVGIEMLFKTTIEPSKLLTKQQFPEAGDLAIAPILENIIDKDKVLDVLRNAREQNNRHDLWLYYSLAYAYVNGFRDIDLYSFAGLLTSIVTGWYGGFGTDYYEKERKIEQRWQFLENRLIEMGCNEETIVKIAIIFLVDQYKKDEKEFKKDPEPTGIYLQSIPKQTNDD